MNKTFYVIIRNNIKEITDVCAVTQLLDSEEEAYKALRRVLEDDLECVNNAKEIINLIMEDIDDCNSAIVKEAGYNYTIVEVEVFEPNSLNTFTPMQDYDQWLKDFSRTIKIPKVGDWYPKDFCIGLLELQDYYDPAAMLIEMGFEKMVLPIDWKDFFTTGKTVFKDAEENEIEIRFSLNKKKWYMDISVRVNDDSYVDQVYIDVEFCESKSQKMKNASHRLGTYCMVVLESLHPIFTNAREKD